MTPRANRVDLFVTGFGRPDLLRDQTRLLRTFLRDRHTVTVLDNTVSNYVAADMEIAALDCGVEYMRVVSDKHEHTDALNRAATLARERNCRFWGCLDHDVFPYETTTVLAPVRKAGFYGLGQTYTPRVGQPLSYLWPGWIFFSADWLAGRTPDFDGIRGEFKWDDGDAGSMLHSLFTPDDWERRPPVRHSYDTIRPEDGHGLQSFGFERLDGWVHFTNASHWKDVPNQGERDSLLREMLASL